MKGLYDVARHLVWLTQFGLSVVVPPTLCIAGSVWLRHRFTLGGWVVAVGVVVGVLAAVSCLRCSLQALDRQGIRSEYALADSFEDARAYARAKGIREVYFIGEKVEKIEVQL